MRGLGVWSRVAAVVVLLAVVGCFEPRRELGVVEVHDADECVVGEGVAWLALGMERVEVEGRYVRREALEGSMREGRPALVTAWSGDGELVGLRIHMPGEGRGCGVDRRATAHALVLLSAGAWVAQPAEVMRWMEALEGQDVSALEAVLSRHETLAGALGEVELRRVLEQALVGLRTRGLERAEQEETLEVRGVFQDLVLRLEPPADGVGSLRIEASLGDDAQTEYVGLLVADELRAWLRPEEVSVAVPRVVVLDRFSPHDRIAASAPHRVVEVPLEALSGHPPQAIPFSVVRPGLLDRDVLRLSAHESQAYGDVTAATLGHAFQLALGLLVPQLADLDVDDLLCQGECCSDLVEGANAALASALEEGFIGLSSWGEVQEVVLAAVEEFLSSAREEPDEPGSGWLVSCLGDGGERRPSWLERLGEALDGFLDLWDQLGTLSELTSVVWALTLGPVREAGTYNLCRGVCGEGACRWEGSRIACGSAGCSTDAACSDGEPCNGQERCEAGRCASGEALVCRASERCVPGRGCVAVGCGADADCADGDVCDGQERCVGGVCVEGAPLACPQGSRCEAARGCVLQAQCTAGACCDLATGRYASRGVPCGAVEERYRCTDSGCGGVLMLQTTRRFCTGAAATCEGALTEQQEIEVAACPDSAVCLTTPPTCALTPACGLPIATRHPEGSLVRVEPADEVYLIQGGERRYIHGHDQIGLWFNLGWDLVVSAEELGCYGMGPDVVPGEPEAQVFIHAFRREGELYALYHGFGYAREVARVDERMLGVLMEQSWGRAPVVEEHPAYFELGQLRPGWAALRPGTPVLHRGAYWVAAFDHVIHRLELTPTELAAVGYIRSDFIPVPDEVPLDRLGVPGEPWTLASFLDRSGCTLPLERRSCYDGPAGTAGVGVCRDGEQTRDPNAADPAWSTCEGQITPTTERCADGLDNDCDRQVDADDGDCGLRCEPGSWVLIEGACRRCADDGAAWLDASEPLDDDDPCTEDRCDVSLGIVHLSAQDGSSCDDGDPATLGDACQGGVCAGCAGPGHQPCGACGAQQRTCEAGRWSPWTSCQGEGVCTPGARQACGEGGERRCGEACRWEPCLGEEVCAAGACAVRFSSTEPATILVEARSFALHDGTPLTEQLARPEGVCLIGWAQGSRSHHQEQPVYDHDADGWIEIPIPEDLQEGAAPYPGCAACRATLPWRWNLRRCFAGDLVAAEHYMDAGGAQDQRTGAFFWVGMDDRCQWTASLAVSRQGEGFQASGAMTSGCP